MPFVALQRRASHLKIRRISEVTDGDSGPTSPDRKRHGMAKSASFPPLSVCREDDETPRPGDDWPWKNLDVAPLPSPSASAATLLQGNRSTFTPLLMSLMHKVTVNIPSTPLPSTVVFPKSESCLVCRRKGRQ